MKRHRYPPRSNRFRRYSSPAWCTTACFGLTRYRSVRPRTTNAGLQSRAMPHILARYTPIGALDETFDTVGEFTGSSPRRHLVLDETPREGLVGRVCGNAVNDLPLSGLFDFLSPQLRAQEESPR